MTGNAADQSVNGGAGADSATLGTGYTSGTLNALGTVNGGAGNDVISFAAGTAAAISIAGGAVATTAVAYNLIVAGAASGDKIKFTSTTLVSTVQITG